MVTSTILAAAYVGACIWLGVRRMEASGAGPKTPRGRLRELGWGLALLALAIGGFGLGVNRWAMAEGRSNSAIAQRPFISEKAVGKHSTSIFAKLDLAPSTDDNRRVLAVLAFLNS